jgi:hypothetical protein
MCVHWVIVLDEMVQLPSPSSSPPSLCVWCCLPLRESEREGLLLPHLQPTTTYHSLLVVCVGGWALIGISLHIRTA